MKHLTLVIFSLACFCLSVPVARSQDQPSAKEPEKKLETSGQWFLAFQHKENDPAIQSNAFVLKRGYITFSKVISKKLAVRYTQDIITDEEGDDAGNIEMRLKYCYLKVNPFETGFLNQSYFEAGMVHRPFLDFEEKTNGYRFQGTMFMERYKVINSADFGITWVSLLGGAIEPETAKSRLSGYPGKYGSIALGVYNGGGYHALEFNKNKTMEGRISLRPLWNRVPALQVTYAFASGRGNTALKPNFENHNLFIAYEGVRTRLGLQYTKGIGNMGGTFLRPDNTPQSIEGYSAFGEVFILQDKLATFLRYDHFEILSSQDMKQRYIGGVCWYFFRKNRLMIDMDLLDNEGEFERTFEAVVEIVF